MYDLNFTLSGTRWVDTMMQQHTIVRQFSVSLFSPKSRIRQTKPRAEVQNQQAKTQNPGKKEQRSKLKEPLRQERSTATHSEDQTNWQQREGRPGLYTQGGGNNNETQVRHIRDVTSGGSDWLIEVICSCTWHITPSAEHFLQPRSLSMFKNELYFYLHWIQRVRISSSHTDQKKISHKDMLWLGMGKGTLELLKTTSLVLTECFTPLLAKILTVVKIQMSVSTTVMLLL